MTYSCAILMRSVGPKIQVCVLISPFARNRLNCKLDIVIIKMWTWTSSTRRSTRERKYKISCHTANYSSPTNVNNFITQIVFSYSWKHFIPKTRISCVINYSCCFDGATSRRPWMFSAFLYCHSRW